MWAFRLEDSPSGHSLVVLAALVPRAAAGYPLLSLTRNAPLTIEPVLPPFGRVVVDVLGDARPFAVIADDAFVIIALPDGCAMRHQPIAVRHARNGGFERLHDVAQ